MICLDGGMAGGLPTPRRVGQESDGQWTILPRRGLWGRQNVDFSLELPAWTSVNLALCQVFSQTWTCEFGCHGCVVCNRVGHARLLTTQPWHPQKQV